MMQIRFRNVRKLECPVCNLNFVVCVGLPCVSEGQPGIVKGKISPLISKISSASRQTITIQTHTEDTNCLKSWTNFLVVLLWIQCHPSNFNAFLSCFHSKKTVSKQKRKEQLTHIVYDCAETPFVCDCWNTLCVWLHYMWPRNTLACDYIVCDCWNTLCVSLYWNTLRVLRCL